MGVAFVVEFRNRQPADTPGGVRDLQIRIAARDLGQQLFFKGDIHGEKEVGPGQGGCLARGWFKGMGVLTIAHQGMHRNGISPDPFGEKSLGGNGDKDPHLLRWPEANRRCCYGETEGCPTAEKQKKSTAQESGKV